MVDVELNRVKCFEKCCQNKNSSNILYYNLSKHFIETKK